MKVLHIIKGLGLAGAEKHLIMLLAGLRQQGVDARLLLWVTPARMAEDVVESATERNIPLERWVMPRPFDPFFLIKLIRYLRSERPDLVHTHLVHAETYAIPAARLAGVPYVVNSSHNDDPFRRRWVFRPRNWLLWRWTDKGIAISHHIKRFLVEVEMARESQIEVIHYGLEPAPPCPEGTLRAELGLAPETPLIGSVCRLVPQKGISDALQALARLPQQVHYALVGDGMLREALEAQAATLGIAQRVHFLGWRNDILPFMAQFDIFLAPSLWEGFGLVLLEAMSQARPIVATRISAIPEIVLEGETGCLVPPQNPPALADALEKLLNNPALAQKMGAAGRARLESDFSPQTMIEKTLALYREVMGA